MSIITQWMMEQAELERYEQIRAWLKKQLGREPTRREVAVAVEDREIEDAYADDVSKDD
jgi:hypothetical protein